MKKFFLLLLALIVVMVVLTACGTTEVPASSETSADTTPPDTTTEKSVEEKLAENPFAVAGLELALTVCEQYYDLRTHTLATSLTDQTAATVWPLASFIEMLAEAHRLYPDNDTIETYYRDVLDKALFTYYVAKDTITPPSGVVYTDIAYYNAGKNWHGDFYYDDNAWICIQLLDAYKQLGDQKYLDKAEKLLEFFWTGWDERAGGGVYWDKTFSDKGICTNGPIGIAYCVGYQLTGNEEYLTRAKMVYDWCGRLTRGVDGLYNAGIKDFNVTDYQPSNLDPWRAGYDQGTMMCTAALLYEITGEQKYYDEMAQTAFSTIGLMFNLNGMEGNPIFKSWCIGWAVRGEMLAYKTGDTYNTNLFMKRLDKVLDATLETKDENGHYDPYFCSGEWWDASLGYFDHDVIQPSGVATALLLTARYQVILKQS